MKKTALNFMARLVVFLCINTVTACDYNVWISSTNHNSSTMDTLCVKEGQSIPLYALHTFNFTTYFNDPIRKLIWTRDGIPFDTTNHGNSIFDGTLYYVTTLHVSLPGIYKVRYVTPNNQIMEIGQVVVVSCESESNSETGLPAGIPQESIEAIMNIYPNPSSNGFINIDPTNPAGISNIEIINGDGMTVSQFAPNTNGIITITTEGFKQGLYFVRINYRGESITKKVILN